MNKSEEQFDIYGDLEDFNYKEQLRAKDIEVNTLTEKINNSVKEITRIENQNELLMKEKKIIKRNLLSLLETAKIELKRKDESIVQLRKEKDDICFRRQLDFKIGKTLQTEKCAQTDLTLINISITDNDLTGNVTQIACQNYNLFKNGTYSKLHKKSTPYEMSQWENCDISRKGEKKHTILDKEEDSKQNRNIKMHLEVSKKQEGNGSQNNLSNRNYFHRYGKKEYPDFFNGKSSCVKFNEHTGLTSHYDSLRKKRSRTSGCIDQVINECSIKVKCKSKKEDLSKHKKITSDDSEWTERKTSEPAISDNQTIQFNPNDKSTNIKNIKKTETEGETETFTGKYEDIYESDEPSKKRKKEIIESNRNNCNKLTNFKKKLETQNDSSLPLEKNVQMNKSLNQTMPCSKSHDPILVASNKEEKLLPLILNEQNHGFSETASSFVDIDKNPISNILANNGMNFMNHKLKYEQQERNIETFSIATPNDVSDDLVRIQEYIDDNFRNRSHQQDRENEKCVERTPIKQSDTSTEKTMILTSFENILAIDANENKLQSKLLALADSNKHQQKSMDLNFELKNRNPNCYSLSHLLNVLNSPLKQHSEQMIINSTLHTKTALNNTAENDENSLHTQILNDKLLHNNDTISHELLAPIAKITERPVIEVCEIISASTNQIELETATESKFNNPTLTGLNNFRKVYKMGRYSEYYVAEDTEQQTTIVMRSRKCKSKKTKNNNEMCSNKQ